MKSMSLLNYLGKIDKMQDFAENFICFFTTSLINYIILGHQYVAIFLQLFNRRYFITLLEYVVH